MCRIFVLVFFLTVITAHLGYSQDVPQDTTQTQLKEGEKKMSETILDILAHYKKSDPVGLPDSLSGYVPDPFPVPDIKQTVSFTTIVLKNTSLYGIRNFRIVGVNAEVGAMEVHAELVMDKLQARGNYTMSSWVNRAQGPYTVDVTAVNVKGRGTLGVERDGKLRAQDIKIDLSFDTIAMNFENLGFLASMFQGVINSLGPVIFDSIKPYILKEAYTKVRSEINVKLDDVAGDMQFPNSISPLDMVIVDARKKVREMNLDPYQVKDYNTSMSIFSITLTHTWITGISSFHRVGNISLLMENNTVIADFEIGTQKLQGTTQWDIYAIGGLMSRAGTATFSVEYISGRIILAQPLDVRKTPEFRNLELEVGNIQVRCDGAGTLDYVIEFAVNVLPNLLRYQIMDGLENPIKEKIQQELDKVNVEEYILQELPKADAMQESGFKLSALVEPKSEDKPYDEDDFFNF